MPWLYRSENYGPLPFDISRNFQMTAVVELPFGKGKHWVSSGKAANILGATIGPALHRLARGIDNRPVAERAVAKQISAESSNGHFVSSAK